MQPQYLLIDTNYWVYLLTKPEYSNSLEKLKKLLDDKLFLLLVPDELVKEINEQFKNHIQKEKDKSATFLKGTNPLMRSVHENLINELEDREGQIKDLVKRGIFIEPSDIVQLDTIVRYRKAQAPFHINKKSNSDCLIYFTSIEYLQQNQIPEFFFITYNHTDFGKPQEEKNVLHPELICENVTTNYFVSIDAFFKTQEILQNLFNEKNPDHVSEKYILKVVEDSNLTFLDVLYLALKRIHEWTSFVPLHILARTSPFRVKNAAVSYSYFETFCMHTNNDELVSFFREIEISATPSFSEKSSYENSEENLEKLYYIIRQLNHNLIFEIAALKGNDRINIRMPNSEEKCDCLECNYGQLLFSRAAKKIVEGNLDDDLLKAARTAFQMGYYSKAIDLYYQIRTKAISDNNKVMAFRSLYHISWTSSFGTFKKPKGEQKRIDEIKAKDFDKEFFAFAGSSKIERELAGFFYDNQFMQHYLAETREIVEKITDHYEMQLKGGFSSNSNYWLLITRYAEFEAFCRRNGLPFSKFSEPQQLSKLFFKAIFMCYSLNEYQSSKILYFDDYILEQFVRYGKSSEIIELYNRYVKTPIPFKEDGDSSFKRIVLNYLTDAEDYLAVEKEDDGGFHSALYDYYETFWTIVTVMAIVKFDDDFVKQCIPLILSFLKSLPEKRGRDVKYLGNFIAAHGHLMTDEQIETLFVTCVNDKSFHDDQLLASFAETNKRQPRLLITNDEIYHLVKTNFFEVCPKCNSLHFDILSDLYLIMDNVYQKRISAEIEESLQNKFDYKLYYHYSIYEIIDANKFKDIYLSCFNPPENKDQQRRLFMQGETQYSGINEVMNLTFKYDWTLPPDFIAKFKGLSSYYDWLLDMENFDYSQFNPLWILQYKVTAYFKKIYSVEQVRIYLREYLKRNYQPDIAKYFALYAP